MSPSGNLPGHDAEEESEKNQISLQWGHSSIGDPQSWILSKDETKTGGKCWEGVIGRSESGLE